MKKALNRLGYYRPYEKVGITGIADMGVFDALKAFQKDHGLSATGSAKPDDETVQRINKEASQTPAGKYIWRTVEDDRVRNAHAQYNRTVRDWSDDPDPGEEFNCRCWAEPIELGLNPVYPELILLPFLRIGRGAIAIAGKILKSIKVGRPVSKDRKLTEHGKLRLEQRKISQGEIDEVIKTAKGTGNIITKMGKYGAPQNIYTGSNGVAVV